MHSEQEANPLKEIQRTHNRKTIQQAVEVLLSSPVATSSEFIKQPSELYLDKESDELTYVEVRLFVEVSESDSKALRIELYDDDSEQEDEVGEAIAELRVSFISSETGREHLLEIINPRLHDFVEQNELVAIESLVGVFAEHEGLGLGSSLVAICDDVSEYGVDLFNLAEKKVIVSIVVDDAEGADQTKDEQQPYRQHWSRDMVQKVSPDHIEETDQPVYLSEDHIAELAETGAVAFVRVLKDTTLPST